jgi:D-aminopeptidase
MPRAGDTLTIGRLPSKTFRAITDVPGVLVGHAGVDEGRLHTGVTAVLPHGRRLYREKVAAACAVFNGHTKSIGLPQIIELGTLETPILLTSTLNVARVADGLLSYLMEQDPMIGDRETVNPVVLECFDGYLSDARARPIGEGEVRAAITAARPGPIEEGCVGAGVGMRCQGFKSGVGTASRAVDPPGYVVGVLVVPNFGFPGDLIIAGVPVGRELHAVAQPPSRGSCAFVVGTDAPVSPTDLRRVAWRCFLGMARTGAISAHRSGDLAVAFSTSPTASRLDPSVLDEMFRATVEASEEAILNALFAAHSMEGRDGHFLPALPVQDVIAILRRHGVAVRGDS